MSEPTDEVQATPGGRKLRALRRAHRLTQLHIEIESELGTGYLQRLESGRVRQPERGTLERILDALNARYSERREILESFGYTVPTPPPTPEEIEWAIIASRQDLDEFPFPAYVLDCTHRLIAWNRMVPRLLGETTDECVRRELEGESIINAWFDPDSPLSNLVVGPDHFLPALIRAFQYEMSRFQTEPWHSEIIESLSRFERFREHRDALEQKSPTASAARAVLPLSMQVPGAGVLQFRLSAEPFTRDARFRIVYYFPSDTRTMEVCAGWEADSPATVS